MSKCHQLDSQIASANIVINKQLTKLKALDKKFSLLDNKLTNKIAVNIRKGDNNRANVLSMELSNVRKIKSTNKKLSIMLELILIRFSTISEFTQVLNTINPMIDMIKDVKDDIVNTGPNAINVISDLFDVTEKITNNTNINIDNCSIHVNTNNDAAEILNEVQSLIEKETKNKLPEVPSNISSHDSNISNIFDNKTTSSTKSVKKTSIMT
ncbi:MAG: hypothetical protein ACPKQO_08210 [Nitrososphaeraceae archaeon]